MKKLYSPENEAELCVIKSILHGEGIHYFVYSDYFGTIKIGPKIDLFNAKTIMVSEDQHEIAKEIIEDFLTKINKKAKLFQSSYSSMDKIRMVIEFLLFGWFIPGNRWKKAIRGL